MDHFHHHVNSWYLASPPSFGVVGRERLGGGGLFNYFRSTDGFCVVSSPSNVFYLQQPPSTNRYFWIFRVLSKSLLKGTTLLTLSIVNTTGRRFWRSSSAQRRVSDRGLHVRPCDRRRYKSVVALTVAAIPRAQAAHHWHGAAPRILAGRTFCTRFCLTAYASACRYLWRRTAAARHTTHCVVCSLVDVI